MDELLFKRLINNQTILLWPGPGRPVCGVSRTARTTLNVDGSRARRKPTIGSELLTPEYRSAATPIWWGASNPSSPKTHLQTAWIHSVMNKNNSGRQLLQRTSRFTWNIYTQDASSCMMGVNVCIVSCRAAAGWAEQSSQWVEGEEEEGKGAQRHAGAVQHASDHATCCRLVQQA